MVCPQCLRNLVDNYTSFYTVSVFASQHKGNKNIGLKKGLAGGPGSDMWYICVNKGESGQWCQHCLDHILDEQVYVSC